MMSSVQLLLVLALLAIPPIVTKDPGVGAVEIPNNNEIKVDIYGTVTYGLLENTTGEGGGVPTPSLAINLNVTANASTTATFKGVACNLHSTTDNGLMSRTGVDYQLQRTVLSHDIMMQLESVAFVECAVLFVDVSRRPLTFVVDLVRGPMSLSSLKELGPSTVGSSDNMSRGGGDSVLDMAVFYLRYMLTDSSVTSLGIGLVILGISFWFLIPGLVTLVLVTKNVIVRRKTRRFINN